MSTRSQRALTTRSLDFWLLGGASVLVWAVMQVLDAYRSHPAANASLTQLSVTVLALSLVVNYPHFMASYVLAYSRGRSFVLSHWPQLIAVPATLIALFAGAYALYDTPLANVALIARARDALATWGANERVLAGPRVGDLLLASGFHLMIFTVGWHYTKQVFGCVMVYAHFDGYPLTPAQRRLTRWTLLAVWAVAFVDNNRDGAWRAFDVFSYASLDLPDAALPVVLTMAGVSLAFTFARVFAVNYRTTGRWPSPNLVIPIVALYVWWMPATHQAEFYFILTPFFHSLQYLAFVYRIGHSHLQRSAHRQVRATTWVLGIVVAGWLAFERVPAAFDGLLGTATSLHLPFFFIAATLFLNIHHYFIDNVLWRLSDAHVRQHLLA